MISYVFTINNENINVLIEYVEIESKEQINSIINVIGEWEKSFWIQIIDYQSVFSIRHVLFSAYIALKKYIRNETITEKPHIELLVLLAGTRQIREAIKKVGLKEHSKKAIVIIQAINEDSKYLHNKFKEIITTYRLKPLDIKEFTANANCSLCTKISFEELEATLGASFEEKLEKNLFMRTITSYLKF